MLLEGCTVRGLVRGRAPFPTLESVSIGYASCDLVFRVDVRSGRSHGGGLEAGRREMEQSVVVIGCLLGRIIPFALATADDRFLGHLHRSGV